MSKLRWARLWWGDWENDPALRLCSLAAQGLWMRLLCLAAQSRVYGHVLVAGQPPTVTEIARIVGARPDQVRRLIDELEAHQVCARVPLDSRQTLVRPSLDSRVTVETPQDIWSDTVIVSRRMVNDYAEHIRKVSAGNRGGNPALMPDRDRKINGSQLKHPLKAEEEEDDSEAEADAGVRTPATPKEEPSQPSREREGLVISISDRKGVRHHDA